MKEAVLKEIERAVMLTLADKFANVFVESERNPSLRATLVSIIASALGETLYAIEYPKDWQRFLRTKRCPKYMKKMVISTVHAYYPHISLPEEKHWVTFERESEKI